MKTFQLEIITPERTIFSGPVSSVVRPGDRAGRWGSWRTTRRCSLRSIRVP